MADIRTSSSSTANTLGWPGRNNVIEESAVERAHELVLSVLDTDFFHVRFERATPAEQRYLAAMASLGDGPQRSGEVTRLLG